MSSELGRLLDGEEKWQSWVYPSWMVLGLVLAVQQSCDYLPLPTRENGLLHHSLCYCLPLVTSGTPELVAPVGHSQAALGGWPGLIYTVHFILLFKKAVKQNISLEKAAKQIRAALPLLFSSA